MFFKRYHNHINSFPKIICYLMLFKVFTTQLRNIKN